MWKQKYLENVEQANRVNEPFRQTFGAFELAAKRAIAVSQEIEPAYVEQLETRLAKLEKQQQITVEQLNQSQKRAREMIEEQYMKTHAVQDLNDEILALQMQLNLSEQKSEKLQNENEQLVERWIQRVNLEADHQSS